MVLAGGYTAPREREHTGPALLPAPQLGSTGPGQGWIQQGSRSWPWGALLPACGADTPSSGRFSVDEGLTWSTHNFTSTSVFVDGLLSEPGDETLVMT